MVEEVARGAMGIVYRAIAMDTNRHVALKTPLAQFSSGPDLARLKNEYYLLTQLHHPNVISVRKLFDHDGQWFVEMEFVDGVDFLRYVRAGRAIEGTLLAPTINLGPSSPEPGYDEPSSSATMGGAPNPARNPEPFVANADLGSQQLPRQVATRREMRPLDWDRLRSALTQLVEGLHFLHQHQIIHRDVKPENIRVTHEGRLVLLDLGLARDLDVTLINGHRSLPGTLMGTVPYMSKEQTISSLLVTEQSDWYSVGVILYEALTGRRPFQSNSLARLLQMIQEDEPIAPGQLAPGIPADLESLCLDLLQKDPTARPLGEEILHRLRANEHVPTLPRTPIRHEIFGRCLELKELEDALAELQAGSPGLVLMRGRSGMGKSILLEHFLRTVTRESRALVLYGRCMERAFVPFKALDQVVEALGSRLRRLDESQLAYFLPIHFNALAKVFPVLEDLVPRRETHSRLEREPADPLELRRRAFAALRELLARLAQFQELPIVVAVDDLQWGDPDSISLLAELLRTPDAPRVLFIGCTRNDKVDQRVLGPLLEVQRRFRQSHRVRRLVLRELGHEDAVGLARHFLKGTGRDHFAPQIAEVSRGHPLLISLLTHGLHWRSLKNVGANHLEDPRTVLDAAINHLREPEQELLYVLAVCGQPMCGRLACQAANLPDIPLEIISKLATDRWLVVAGAAAGDTIDLGNDVLRDTLLERLRGRPDAARAIHERLATTMRAFAAENHVTIDDEVLAYHFQQAGRFFEARCHFIKAAERATEALAFSHAASLYDMALNSARNDDSDHELRQRRAESLADAGRSEDAAREYLGVAESADFPQSLELRRKAVLQLVISRDPQAGQDVLAQVLEGLGLRLPRSQREVIVPLLSLRLASRIRGYQFRRRSTETLPPIELAKIDACWTAVMALTSLDIIRAWYFHKIGLRLSLKAGEPSRVVRTLANEVAYIATAGSRTQRRADALLKKTSLLARSLQDPSARGTVALMAGIAAFLQGRWRHAQRFCQAAESILRHGSVGKGWEIGTALTFRLWSLACGGQIAELARLWPTVQREARERGDVKAALDRCSHLVALIRLRQDQPSIAAKELDELKRLWEEHGYHTRLFHVRLAQVGVDLYQGNAAQAWEQVAAFPSIGPLDRLLHVVQQLRVELRQLHGRSALAAAAQAQAQARVPASPPNRHLLRQALQDAHSLRGEKLPWAEAYSLLIRGGIAALRSDRAAAIRGLRAASSAFDECQMPLQARCCQYRAAELAAPGDEVSSSELKQVRDWLFGEGVENPEKMVQMFVPYRIPCR